MESLRKKQNVMIRSKEALLEAKQVAEVSQKGNNLYDCKEINGDDLH